MNRKAWQNANDYDRPLHKIGRPPQRQGLLEGAKQSSKVVVLGPARNLEKGESATHLGVALKGDRSFAGAHGNRADLQIVDQILSRFSDAPYSRWLPASK